MGINLLDETDDVTGTGLSLTSMSKGRSSRGSKRISSLHGRTTSTAQVWLLTLPI